MEKSNKVKSAERFSKFESIFKCPLCERSINVVDFKSLICARNHTFDFAKQGYVNLLTRPANSHYKKELFEARHNIITETNLYTELQEMITNVIKEQIQISSSPLLILDVGCGEGSHLQKIVEECNPPVTGIGIDISREGIVLASKRYQNSMWVVGDLAKSPFNDQSFHVILNILSPSNYKEFKRILIQDGIIIKVVPRPNYLRELREVFFDDKEKRSYQNDETASLFIKHFQLINTIRLSYTKELRSTELTSLVQMSPLSWNSKKEQLHTLINRRSSEITVDLDILIGINKKKTETSR